MQDRIRPEFIAKVLPMADKKLQRWFNENAKPEIHWILSNWHRMFRNEVITLENGDIYFGEINDEGWPNGYGFRLWASKDVLIESYFENGEEFGNSRRLETNKEGIIVDKLGTMWYGNENGYWEDKYSNGTLFQGLYAHGKWNGMSKISYP